MHTNCTPSLLWRQAQAPPRQGSNPPAGGSPRGPKVRSDEPEVAGVNGRAYPAQNRHPRLGGVFGARNANFAQPPKVSAYYFRMSCAAVDAQGIEARAGWVGWLWLHEIAQGGAGGPPRPARRKNRMPPRGVEEGRASALRPTAPLPRCAQNIPQIRTFVFCDR